MSDERIKRAAAELSAALSEGGKEYWVEADSIDVTRRGSASREFVYRIKVTEPASRQVAP